jgi:hypothetical protein
MVDSFVNSSAVFSNKDQRWDQLRIWYHRANRHLDRMLKPAFHPRHNLPLHQLAQTEDL